MVPNTDRMLERYIEGLPLNIKGNEKTLVTNGNGTETTTTKTTPTTLVISIQNKRPETTRVFTAGQGSYAGKLPYCGKCRRHTLTHALLLVTTVEGQDIRSKTAELYLVPQAKEDPKAKEDREVMLLASSVRKGNYKNKVPE
ncbi:hypothetical protein Tco_1123512 [Tanacetum coccineum]|uniref:Uncharacterized protein n=1 Tax=Tanacetum coccineum TaxID=301880 RepID=A0ABQ5J6E2_9ASTR